MKFILSLSFLLIVQLTFSQDVIVEKIEFKGLKITKEKTVLRELLFEVGDTIDVISLNKKIEISRRNIEKQWLFNFTEIDTKIEGNRVSVVVDVVERWYVWPYPILEISERNFNVFYDSLRASNFTDFSRLNYGVFLNWYNFRGRNELLLIKFRKGYKEHYQFEYQIPYVNKKKNIGVAVGVELFRMKKYHYKTFNNSLLYVESESDHFKDLRTSIALQYKAGIHASHQIFLQRNSAQPSPEIHHLINNFLPNSKENFSYYQLSYLFNIDKRNSVSYPTEGSFREVQLDYFEGINSDYNDIILTTKTEQHYNLHPRWLIGNSLKFKLSTNDTKPYILNESLGFEDYARGYEYYVIDGEHYWLTKTALKFALVPKRKLEIPYLKISQFNKAHYSYYLTIFADMGKVYDSQYGDDNSLSNTLLFSQGISLDFVTYYDKLLRLEYSRNHLNEWGFFIHFSNPF